MIVLDTNVVSEFLKAEPDPQVRATLGSVADIQAVTSLTLAEIWQGIAYLPQGRKRQALQQSFQSWLSMLPKESILPFDEAAAHQFGLVRSRRKEAGEPISYPDAIIAAICLAYDAPLYTRNVRDFEGLGLQILNPWDK